MSNIDILLSTYNGEEYLAEQLDSLFIQDFSAWHLYVRDDGSTDGTLKVLKIYLELYPNKITLINDRLGNLGPAKSFFYLMQISTAPYLAFCDQDDVWLSNKLSLKFKEMREAEALYTSECPLLVHTDLIVVDQHLKLVASSLWGHQKFSPEIMRNFNRLLIQNFVTGCTCLINRKLVELSQPLPDKVIMHDWWMALLAQSRGQIINVAEATILYRQHGMNDTGAKKWGVKFIFTLLKSGSLNMHKSLLKTRDQAIELSKLDVLTKDECVVVKNYIDMFQLGWVQRRMSMLKNGFFKYGLLRNIAVFMYL